MTDTEPQTPADDVESGNYVEPVDLGKDSDDDVIVGPDPEEEKGDFTTSTDYGDGQTTPPNVEREDGAYTETQSNDDRASGEPGEYTDRDDPGRLR